MVLFAMGGSSLTGCEYTKDNLLFEKLSSSHTGIHFTNELTFTKKLNPYTYRNFYNGGGVAVGDINNDGLVDIYFTGNQVSNKLYLNKGNFEFEDITGKAGVAVRGVWSTGATMVDVNGDKLLDIYVTKSGSPGGENRHNELFINNGDSSFTERSKEYGLDITGLATDAMFFDYDRDGDLDMYLLNNSLEALKNINIQKGLRENYDEKGGGRLFRNELVSESPSAIEADSTRTDQQKRFVEVTKKAGIYSSKIGFGLDIAVSDINGDGWPDIYISNDFFERDYLYFNNGDGTFTEILPELMPSISLSSMGADAADINHDGRPDIYVTDMLPAQDDRLKSKTAFDSWAEYQKKVTEGYHHQFVRNTLQMNNGKSRLTGAMEGVPDSLQLNTFSEIGRMAGVEATDWSWSTLIADYDNDGHNDIYVTNGIGKDLTDQDYVNDRMNVQKLRSVVEEGKPVSILFNKISSSPLSNYAFSGTDSLKFINKAEEWGLASPGFSNGAAYADLNNDGALDLVVNNIDKEASIYRNRQAEHKHENNWFMVRLKGQPPNTSAIGSKVKLWTNDRLFYREQMPGRGFQSSVDHRIHFGLGDKDTIDSLLIQWPDGSTTFKRNIESNKIAAFEQDNADKVESNIQPDINGQTETPRFREVTSRISLGFKHRENNFVDFDRDRLLFHKRSTEGPPVCIADIDGNGMDDFYMGGAKGQAGGVFIQQKNQSFIRLRTESFVADKESEDTACTWFDANGDELMDLYVTSGGSEFPASSTSLSDRLYLNDGGNSWSKYKEGLPSSSYEVSAVVKAADINQDGHMDLFTGTRLKPFAYGLPVNGNILLNDGNANFKNVTEQRAPGLLKTGFITDAAWLDYDNDGDLDLVVVGEWMPIRVFKNSYKQTGRATFEEVTSEMGLEDSRGLWQSVEISDLDGDGKKDIVAGNIGTNTRLKAGKEYPLKMWTNDFDQNGSIEQVIAYSDEQGVFPLALRDALLDQIPSLKKKLPTYASYAGKTVDQIFSREDLSSAVLSEVYTLESAILWNTGKDKFREQKLSQHTQISPVYGIHTMQDKKGGSYLLTGGNLSGVKPEIGRYGASYGSLFKIGSDRKVEHLPNTDTGFELHGEVRGIYSLRSLSDTLILISRNNDNPLWFKKDRLDR